MGKGILRLCSEVKKLSIWGQCKVLPSIVVDFRGEEKYCLYFGHLYFWWRWVWNTGGNIMAGGDRKTGTNTCPVPLCSPQILFWHAWNWTWAYVVKGRRLTAQTIAYTFAYYEKWRHFCSKRSLTSKRILFSEGFQTCPFVLLESGSRISRVSTPRPTILYYAPRARIWKLRQSSKHCSIIKAVQYRALCNFYVWGQWSKLQ